MPRNYSNIAFDTTLSAGIAAGDLTCVVASAAGWPAVPFAAVLDPGSLTVEEVVQVTNVAGTTFTITRGFDGTTAAAHSAGVTVRHSAIAGDFTDLQAADTASALAIANETSARAAADALRLLIANYDWNTLPNKPAFGALALLSTITASLISDASANGQSLITAANYAAMRTLLTLVIGTDVQAFNANLAALAGLTLAADRSIYSTGVGALALYTLSSFARTLLDDADAAAARTTLDAAPNISLGRIVVAGVTQLTIPGVISQSTFAGAIVANQIRYFPIVIYTPTTLDQLTIEIATASAGGTTVRLAIYNADTGWNPTTLVIDAGTVAADSLGVKSTSINQLLVPGRYLFALNSDAAPSLRVTRGSIAQAMIIIGMSATLFINIMRVTSTYAAFVSTGIVPTTTPAQSAPFDYMMYCRISSSP